MSMRPRTTLEVRPVLRYPEPAYPCASQLEAALRLREPWPWPWTISPAFAHGLLTALVTMGCSPSPAPIVSPPPAVPPPAAPPVPPPPVETAAAPATIATAPEPAPPPAPRTIDPPDLPPQTGLGLQHPFSWEASQLPIEWHPYGTGAPARLSEQQVRPVVERVLLAAGIHAAPRTRFDRPGIAAELSGYDASKHIGWLFVDWPTLEDPAGYSGFGKAHGKDGSDFNRMVSHAEIKRIMQLEKEGKEHVIVISYQDSRFSRAWDVKHPFPETELRKLENALRAYLGWLKSQGAL